MTSSNLHDVIDDVITTNDVILFESSITIFPQRFKVIEGGGPELSAAGLLGPPPALANSKIARPE